VSLELKQNSIRASIHKSHFSQTKQYRLGTDVAHCSMAMPSVTCWTALA